MSPATLVYLSGFFSFLCGAFFCAFLVRFLRDRVEKKQAVDRLRLIMRLQSVLRRYVEKCEACAGKGIEQVDAGWTQPCSVCAPARKVLQGGLNG